MLQKFSQNLCTLLLTLAVVCSQGAGASSLPDFGASNPPAQTIEDFYTAICSGDLEKVRSLFHYLPGANKDTLAGAASFFTAGLAGECTSIRDRIEKKGGIAQIDIFPEKNPEETGKDDIIEVRATIYFKDNFHDREIQAFLLINTGGNWKICIHE